jgi:thioredoxin-dependent peroxiredoxin
VILGASFDTVEDNRAFAAKFDFPFPLLCDTAREIGLAYGACEAADAGYANRISYLIKDGRIVKTYGEVAPARHPGEVLEDLAALTTDA